MAIEDRFDSPTISTEEIELEEGGIGGKVSGLAGPVKQNLRYIIAGAAVIAVAFFAYSYFFAGVESVTIRVVDTEGKALNASVKLYAEGSSEPFFSESNASSYTVQLRHGSYRAEAKASGYTVKRTSLAIGPGDSEKEIELQKNLDVEILGFESAFPKKLFVGQTAQLEVQLKNNSSETVQVELEPEGALEGMAGPTAATVMGNSTETATINVSVPEDTEVKDIGGGDSKTASLRVKYTRKKANAKFTLLPNPWPNITLSENIKFSVKAIEGKNKQSKRIRVSNSNKFAVESLQLSIEITAATENSKEEVKEWFQFTEVADQPEPWKIGIAIMPAAKSIEKELQVVVPLVAEDEKGMKGNIVLSAAYLPQPIKQGITLDVTEKATHGIELSLSPRRDSYEIEWDGSLGKYGEETITLSVKNSGQIGLQNINFSTDNDSECHNGWLVFLENTIDSLEAGKSEELRLKATAPIAQRGQESPMLCDLRYWYDDPFQEGERVEETILDFIRIEPERE